MRFGLTDETITKINTVFVKYSEIEEVVLYGSRAKGNYREGSDIDLTLKGDLVNYRTLLNVLQDVDDLNTPYLFDISVYHQLSSESLIEHINRIGIIFYKKGSLSPSKGGI